MVGRDAALQAVQPLVVAENAKVFIENGAAAFLDDIRDLFTLELGGESHAGPEHLLDGLVAPHPTEDEEDGGEQVALSEHLHDAGAIHFEIIGATSSGVPTADILHLAGADGAPAVAGHLHEFRIHPVRGSAGWIPGAHFGRGEQVDEFGTHDHVLVERYRTLLRDDHRRLAAHRLQPVTEFLGVRHRGAERHQAHVLREVDDDLLPHRSPEPVGEVMHLVHHDEGEIPQQVGVGVEHVAQHLGGHHHDAGTGVDIGVAGEQPHLAGTVLGNEFLELLVREGLHRCRVEHLRARLLHGEEDGEFGHNRLAGAGRGCDEHAVTTFQCDAGCELKRVEVEGLVTAEQLNSGGAATLP